MTVIRLPAPAQAAAGGTATVWCAAGDQLLSFDQFGVPRLTHPLSDVRSLATVGETVAAVIGERSLAWINGETGEIKRQEELAGRSFLASGGGAIWVIESDTGSARRVIGPGKTSKSISVRDVGGVASDGDQLWWFSTRERFVREEQHVIALNQTINGPAAMTLCSGSVWLGVGGGLLSISAWNGQTRPMLPIPVGDASHLTCGAGILVGGSSEGLFVLDPSADADVRRLDAAVPGQLGHLVATRFVAWAFSADSPVAVTVPIREGRPAQGEPNG